MQSQGYVIKNYSINGSIYTFKCAFLNHHHKPCWSLLLPLYYNSYKKFTTCAPHCYKEYRTFTTTPYVIPNYYTTLSGSPSMSISSPSLFTSSPDDRPRKMRELPLQMSETTLTKPRETPLSIISHTDYHFTPLRSNAFLSEFCTNIEPLSVQEGANITAT